MIGLKRAWAWMILAALLCAAIPVSAAPFLPAEGILRTNVQLRTEPSEQSESQMILLKGQSVLVMELVGNWVRVQYGSFSGYIRGDLFVDTTHGDSPYADLHYPADPQKPIGLGFDAVLKMGKRGPYVQKLQEALLALGYYDKATDGIFGDNTKAAVKAFQKAHGLRADGVVGEDTYEALAYALDEVTQKPKK